MAESTDLSEKIIIEVYGGIVEAVYATPSAMPNYRLVEKIRKALPFMRPIKWY